MNFINLRNVANKEINESFSGILRISPYKISNATYDDPTPLLNTIGEEVHLSDSDGNFLNITFIPEVFETYVTGYADKVRLISITQKVSNLYVVEQLNVKPTLYLNTAKDVYPIQIINKDGVLTFPIDAPEDTRYLNHNNRLNFDLSHISSDETIKNKFDSLPASHEIYSKAYEDYHVKVNGKKIYRPNGTHSGEQGMVPELYKHDYVLGQYPNHTHKIVNKDVPELNNISDKIKKNLKRATKLSFIPIEKIIWSLLEGATSGAYRSFEGRYMNLLPTAYGVQGEGTENNLFKELFVSSEGNDDFDTLAEKIKEKAHLVGLPVQTGLVMYNAIPAKRFFFHTLRRYSDEDLKDAVKLEIPLEDTEVINSEDSSEDGTEIPKEEVSNPIRDFISKSAATNSLFMHNLTTEYALCDGKRIKAVDGDSYESDYPSLNRKSKAFSEWNGYRGDSIDSVYDAIATSMDNEIYVKTIRTPELFDIKQSSLRYLRGINWQRGVSYQKRVSENDTTLVNDAWLYNHKSDVINPDGTYIIGDWNNPQESDINNANDVMKPDYIENTKKYRFFNNTYKMVLPNTDPDDRCNIIKDIRYIGKYYCNYDTKVSDGFRHVHQLVTDDDLLIDNDELSKVNEYYTGRSETNKPDNEEWDGYVRLENETFLGTYVMRSIQGVSDIDKATLKVIKDLPISYRGGTTSFMRMASSSYKAGSRVAGSCVDNHHKGVRYWQPEGGYELTGYIPRTDGVPEGWRFLSSLPVTNKYGSWSDPEDYAYSIFGDKKVLLDDSLSMPPSINLLPLFKI